MTEPRAPIPPGRVSIVRGRWQGPALIWSTRIVLAASLAGGILGGRIGRSLAVSAVAAVVAIPIGRVLWLVGRWHHEGDTRFAIAGIALLVTIVAGGVLAALGVG